MKLNKENLIYIFKGVIGWTGFLVFLTSVAILGWSCDHPQRYLIVTNGQFYCIAHQHSFWSKPAVYDWEKFNLYSEAKARLDELVAKEEAAKRPWKETKE